MQELADALRALEALITEHEQAVMKLNGAILDRGAELDRLRAEQEADVAVSRRLQSELSGFRMVQNRLQYDRY